MDTSEYKLNSVVGQRIRVLRKMMGLSQIDLAGKLGFSYQQLQKYETGKNNISLKLVEDVGRELLVSPTELLDQGYANPEDISNNANLKKIRKKWHDIGTISSIKDKNIKSDIAELVEAIEAAAMAIEAEKVK